MILFYYIKELGLKISYYLGILFLLFFIGHYHKLALLKILLIPIKMEYLICIDPLETTWTFLFLSCAFATWISLPILILLFVSYLTPSLYQHEFHTLLFILGKYLLLLLLSSLSIYYFVIPIILNPLFS